MKHQALKKLIALLLCALLCASVVDLPLGLNAAQAKQKSGSIGSGKSGGSSGKSGSGGVGKSSDSGGGKSGSSKKKKKSGGSSGGSSGSKSGGSAKQETWTLKLKGFSSYDAVPAELTVDGKSDETKGVNMQNNKTVGDDRLDVVYIGADVHYLELSTKYDKWTCEVTRVGGDTPLYEDRADSGQYSVLIDVDSYIPKNELLKISAKRGNYTYALRLYRDMPITGPDVTYSVADSDRQGSAFKPGTVVSFDLPDGVTDAMVSMNGGESEPLYPAPGTLEYALEEKDAEYVFTFTSAEGDTVLSFNTNSYAVLDLSCADLLGYPISADAVDPALGAQITLTFDFNYIGSFYIKGLEAYDFFPDASACMMADRDDDADMQLFSWKGTLTKENDDVVLTELNGTKHYPTGGALSFGISGRDESFTISYDEASTTPAAPAPAPAEGVQMEYYAYNGDVYVLFSDAYFDYAAGEQAFITVKGNECRDNQDNGDYRHRVTIPADVCEPASGYGAHGFVAELWKAPANGGPESLGSITIEGYVSANPAPEGWVEEVPEEPEEEQPIEEQPEEEEPDWDEEEEPEEAAEPADNVIYLISGAFLPGDAAMHDALAYALMNEIRSAPDGMRFTVLRAGDTAERLCVATDDRMAAIGAVTALEYGDEAVSFYEALCSAAEIARLSGETDVYFIANTDTRDADSIYKYEAARDALQAAPMRLHALIIGDNTPVDNLGALCELTGGDFTFFTPESFAEYLAEK